MSRDSFFLFYAEIYVNRGILDTALALNYYIKDGGDKNLYTEKFKQRYLIYSTIGLNSEADKALDSLGISIDNKKSRYFHFPNLSIGINGKYQKNKELPEKTYSFTKSDHDEYSLYNEKAYNLDCTLEWDLPWLRDHLFTVGVNYTSGKPSTQKPFEADSLSHDFSAYLRYNGIKSFSTSYKFTRKINSYNDYSSSNSLFFSWINQNKSGYSKSISLLGSFDYAKSHISNQTYFLQSSIEKSFNSNTFNLSFSAYLNRSDKLQSDTLISNIHIMYIDDVTSPKPVHYYKDSLSVAIPFNFTPFLSQKYRDNSKDTSIIAIRYPQTTVYISPSIDFSRLLFWGINFTSTLEWALTYYTTPYYWIDMGIDENYIINNYVTIEKDGHYLAYNKKDGQLYYVRNPYGVNDEDIGNSPVQQHTRNRIDNAFTINISFSHSIWKICNFSIGGAIEKNISTLGNDSPVEIPNWFWNISSSLTFNYPFRKQ